MADYLANSVRTFMFSTAPAPPLAAAAVAALELIEERPELPRQLQENAAVLRGALRAEGFEMPDSGTHLMPLAFGDPEVAMDVCERSLAGGVYAQALRPPTVPPGRSRLRLTAERSSRSDQPAACSRHSEWCRANGVARDPRQSSVAGDGPAV
mgnify:CR=1 FL=1